MDRNCLLKLAIPDRRSSSWLGNVDWTRWNVSTAGEVDSEMI